MDENKKKSKPEEEKDKETSENPEQEKPETEKEEQKPEDKPKDEKSEDKAPDDKQADENGEGEAPEKADEKPEDKPDDPEEKKDEFSPAADPKDEEILKLKTQIAAMQMGFKPECMEDAVVLAESYVKSGLEKDINSALSAVMKKYSDWKADGGKSDSKKSGGFKVGAGEPEKKPTDDEKLNNAFGIKKKK